MPKMKTRTKVLLGTGGVIAAIGVVAGGVALYGMVGDNSTSDADDEAEPQKELTEGLESLEPGDLVQQLALPIPMSLGIPVGPTVFFSETVTPTQSSGTAKVTLSARSLVLEVDSLLASSWAPACSSALKKLSNKNDSLRASLDKGADDDKLKKDMSKVGAAVSALAICQGDPERFGKDGSFWRDAGDWIVGLFSSGDKGEDEFDPDTDPFAEGTGVS